MFALRALEFDPVKSAKNMCLQIPFISCLMDALMFECREGCGSVDSIFHWNNSLCYAHLKSTNMTGSDEELCKFYSRVIKFRMQN